MLGIAIVALALNLVANALLIPRMGLEGAGAARSSRRWPSRAERRSCSRAAALASARARGVAGRAGGFRGGNADLHGVAEGLRPWIAAFASASTTARRS
jgi:hypothetical protein